MASLRWARKREKICSREVLRKKKRKTRLYDNFVKEEKGRGAFICPLRKKRRVTGKGESGHEEKHFTKERVLYIYAELSSGEKKKEGRQKS